MEVLEIKQLKIPDIKVIRYGRFLDNRGYFSESYRLSDVHTKFLNTFKFLQVNESFSKKGVIRGLHFQWNPYMGKLVRTIKGTMVDIALDIRLGSPTFGKAILYKIQTHEEKNHNEWIWIPPGFAHGNFFLEDTIIEYFCTGEYNPECEAAISPLSEDISWSMADSKLKKDFEKFKKSNLLISEKDKNGYSLQAWSKSRYSKNFPYSKLRIR